MQAQSDASELFKLSKKERKKILENRIRSVDASKITDPEKATEKTLRKVYQITTVLDPILKPYIEHKIQSHERAVSNRSSSDQTESIRRRIEAIKTEFVNWLDSLHNEDEIEAEVEKVIQQSLFNAYSDELSNESIENAIEKEIDTTNLFTLFETELLAISNSVTRKLSTKMGNFLEEAATYSPYAISTEKEFGIKIPGVDIIILTNDEIEFIQLKTKKDTLTGSQVPRVKKELSLHKKSSFVAAFDAGKWSFSSDEIPSYAGREFWRRIHIDYDLMESYLRNAFREIEEAYLKLVRRKFIKPETSDETTQTN